jgi:hypothetical protein
MLIKTDAESALRYGRALYDIQALMSGKEWGSGTLDEIAEIMYQAGFHIYDSDDCDGAGPRQFLTGSGLVELEMSLAEARSASRSGSCDDDVLALSKVPHIAEQLATIDPELLKNELRDYGAWDDTELADHEQNLQRLVRIAAGDIVEEANNNE